MKPTCRWLTLFAATALPLLAGAADPTDPNSPAAYAIRIPVTVAADAPLQRIMLPAEALVRLQSAGYADLRLFNGAGQPVPMALAGVASAAGTQEQKVPLAAYPILGAANTAGGAGLEGLSLRIEERQGKRVVQLNTTGSTAGNAAPVGASPKKVWGALLDARAIKLPVARMALDADLPAGQPVTFKVQASKDLKNWQPIAETVLYALRAEGFAAEHVLLGGAVVPRLQAGGIDLHGEVARRAGGGGAALHHVAQARVGGHHIDHRYHRLGADRLRRCDLGRRCIPLCCNLRHHWRNINHHPGNRHRRRAAGLVSWHPVSGCGCRHPGHRHGAYQESVLQLGSVHHRVRV